MRKMMEGIIDPLKILETPIQTENNFADKQLMVNSTNILVNSVEISKYSLLNPIENYHYSCKSCRKKFGVENLLKTHERFCAN